MLCQNCRRNDASVHLKRIINGESAEIHLCGMCASALGANDSFMGFSAFGAMSGSGSAGRISNRSIRCETCGFTFEDITKTGFPGCPDCYRVFSQKMRPIIQKIHGRAVYKGRKQNTEAQDAFSADEKADELALLREKLRIAVEQQFELAAVLRDEIREKEGKGEQ